MKKYLKCSACYIVTVNIVLTIGTCFLIGNGLQGCTPGELSSGSGAVIAAHQGLHAVAPAMAGQPWFITVMLAADIASSCAAGLLVILKQQNAAEKSKDNGNN